MEEDKLETIGKVTMNYAHYSGVDYYSDGKSEDVLLDIVMNNSETEYNRIIAEHKEWPILYHLSHIRGNIVEWYPFEKDAKVLEIGSGCGAITGTVAKKVKSVTCVELSKKRSMINAYRNKNLDNIEIMVGNFQDVEKDLEKYDYITLIGVLEYAASYIGTDNPYEDFINIIKKHLNPNGKIIIAIENKYGLKYWAGCKEDHVSRYYEGIEGYRDTKSVRTFSKTGLEELAKVCNMSNIEFYYPYPDYKLPTVIHSDEYLPKVGELTNNLRNLDNDRMITFNEAYVYDSLIEDGMYPIFANSYLVIMSEGE